MRKVTNAHYVNIIAITLATMQEYTDFLKRCANDADTTAEDNVMHYDDLLYIQSALKDFVQDRNAKQLQDRIMMQDTFVREYYIDTLRYIEEENLSDEHYCAW
jgi:hypothetical protein